MKQKLPVIILLCISLVLLTFITPSFLHNKKHEISNNQLVASHIYGLIAGNIERPIGISTGLSSDEFLVRTLEQEENIPENIMEEMMSSFLGAVKNQFGYDASFVVSEKTKRYYTPTGIAKIVNPQEDPYDNWYQMFLDTNLPIQLETDRDQLFDWRWSIFINARIVDSNGTTLGVCGIALSMEDWQKMLLAVEKEYKVKINLIDTQGLVQIDTDFNNIKNAYLSEAISDHASEREFTHTDKAGHGYRMTRFMPNLKWYLVVQGKNEIEAQFAGASIILVIYILLFVCLFLSLFDTNKKNKQHEFVIKSTSPVDELTKLPNRNYLKEAYGELGVFNTTRYKSLSVFDIDHFKVINDERDGDKIVLGIVEIAKELLDDRGILFRWSGDEFVLFMEMEIDEAENQMKALCEKAKEKLDITVSVGLVKVDLSVSIKINYYRAVQNCYAIKEAGGNGVGRQ